MCHNGFYSDPLFVYLPENDRYQPSLHSKVKLVGLIKCKLVNRQRHARLK